MAILNVNNPGDIVLDQAPEPLPVSTTRQVPPPAAAAPAPTPASPPQQRFTKIDPTQIKMDAPQPVQTQPGIQKLPPNAAIKLDPPKNGDESYLKAAGDALVRGAVQGGTDVAHAASPFTDRGPGKVPPDAVDQVINGPIWRGDIKNTIGGLAVKTAHNIGANAPSLGLGIAGAIGGGAAGGPIGATAGGAAGFGVGSGLQEIAPAYQRGIADGLTHDQAVDRAIKETLVAGGFGVIAGLAPEVKFFGKSWQMSGVGADGIAEMVKQARKPISEALAQVYGVQPAIGAAQQKVDASIENKPLTAADIASGYVNNAATGAALSGLHGVKNMILPETQPVTGAAEAAPGTSKARPQPPVQDADIVTQPKKLVAPGDNGQTTQNMGGDGTPPAQPGAPAYGAQPTVDVPLTRDDLAAAINNGTPLPTKKTITLPDANIDPALKAQGYTVGNKVQQVTDDGEVHEGTVTSAVTGDDGHPEVTILDHGGNLRTLFGTDGQIKAAALPQPPRPPVTPAVTSPVTAPPPQAPMAQTIPADQAQRLTSSAPSVPRETTMSPQKPENLYAQMDLPALKNSLDFVNSHGKQNGWNRSSTATKRLITQELNTRFPEWGMPARVDLANAAADVAPTPTEAQQEAGNHQMGHTSIQGLPVTIEKAAGQIRSGTDRNGNEWKTQLPAHYGYIKRTEGADGEHVDTYIGNNPSAKHVYVVDQIKPDTKAFDEHKAMVGFPSKAQAMAAYNAAFSDGSGAARMGAVTAMTVPDFKEWLKNGDTKKPMAYKPQKTSQQHAADLLNIYNKSNAAEADKAFQKLRQKLPQNQQEEIRVEFARLVREENNAKAAKSEPSAENNKPPVQQPESGAATAQSEPNSKQAPVEHSGGFKNSGDTIDSATQYLLDEAKKRSFTVSDISKSENRYGGRSNYLSVDTPYGRRSSVRVSDHDKNINFRTEDSWITGSNIDDLKKSVDGLMSHMDKADAEAKEKYAPVIALKDNKEFMAKWADLQKYISEYDTSSGTYYKIWNKYERLAREYGLPKDFLKSSVVKDILSSKAIENKAPATKEYGRDLGRAIKKEGFTVSGTAKIKDNNIVFASKDDSTFGMQTRLYNENGAQLFGLQSFGGDAKSVADKMAEVKGFKPVEATNGAVRQEEIQGGIPDRAGNGEAATVAVHDEGQNAPETSQGEGGGSGAGVSIRGSLPDAESQHGSGAGGEGGIRNSAALADTVSKPAVKKEPKKTVTVAGKERPDPIGATLPSLRRMDSAVSKEFAENHKMSDEHFAELEKYARDIQEEIEKQLIEKNGADDQKAMYSFAKNAANLFQSAATNAKFVAEKNKIETDLNERMKTYGYIDSDVKLFNDPREIELSDAPDNVQGAYHHGLIYISLNADDPVKSLDHEAIHELRDSGAFTKQEWATLEKKAPEWRKKYNIDKNYGDLGLSESQANEEAIAHAFQDHDMGGIIRRIANRAINFIKKIGAMLRGVPYHFETVKDIFDAVRRGDISDRKATNDETSAAPEEKPAEEDFPMYSLKKSPKEGLDEAAEALSKVRGLDKTFISDLKRVSATVLHPHQIATLHKEFTPVYRAVVERFKQREVMIHQLSKNIALYNKINQTGKDKVDAALEIGRLTGQTFKPGDDGTITVKNEGLENTVKSNSGDTIKLNQMEAQAYVGVRQMFDTALEKYKDTILADAGLLDRGIKNAQDVEKLRAEAVKNGDMDQVRSLKNVLQQLNDVAEAKKKGYVPFKRWGDVGISVKNDDGETVHFERVEIPNRDRKKGFIGKSGVVQDAIARLTKKYPADKYEIHTFEMSKFNDVAANVDLRNLDILAASSEMEPSEYEKLREMLQNELQKKGFRSHFFKAKDVPGYGADFERAINDYAVTISSYIARRLNNSKIESAVAGIAESGKSKLHDYAKNYVDYVNNPREELATVRMLGFFWYLAGNISSGVVNLTQPFILTGPWLKGSFKNTQIGKEMTKAYADVLKLVDLKNAGGEVFNFEKAPADVRDALVKAYNEGDFLSLTTNDAMAISSTSQALRGLDKTRRTVMDALGMTFSIPEKINRIVTFTSAYRLAMWPGAQDKIRNFVKNDQLGKAMLAGKTTPEDFAFAYAELATVSTQFRIGNLNRPEVARGFGSLVFQFQSFTMQCLELMYKLAKVNGGHNKMALAAIILGVIALAGTKGPPFEENAKNLIEELFKFATKRDLDIDTDIREAIIKYTHSPMLAEALIKGAPAALLNVDLSGRLGFGNIAPDPNKISLGPWMDILYNNPKQAAADASEGRYLQALADVAPSFIKNPMTAYMWSNDGVRTQKGAKIIDSSKISQADVTLKALGFTSSDISTKRDQIWATERANSAVNDLKTSYYNNIAKDVADRLRFYKNGDTKSADQMTAKIEGTMDEIRHYNQTVPAYQMIKISPFALKAKVMQEMIGAEGKKVSKMDALRDQQLKQIYQRNN